MRYQLGEFELDGDAYTLTRSGVELPLQRKVFDLLRYLLERPNQVVTKSELLDTLWRGEHVNEGAVPWTVFHARRALGQERGDRAPIETVQGRGYRLLGEVTADVCEAPRESPRRAPQAAAGLPFVGRAEVMTRLESRLSQALSGGGGACLLVGEAGIGKTRCAEELRDAAARVGARTWSGRSTARRCRRGREPARARQPALRARQRGAARRPLRGLAAHARQGRRARPGARLLGPVGASDARAAPDSRGQHGARQAGARRARGGAAPVG